MNDLTLSAVMPAIDLVNGQPMTTSVAVADYFGRAHRHVLRDIKALDCSAEFRRPNFGPSSYINAQGKTQPCFQITRDGLVFLIMGWTGERAARKKEAYIAAFNAMEAALRLAPGEVKVARRDLEHYARCERDLLRTQRRCIQLQGRLVRELGRQVRRAEAAAQPQGDLFGGGA